MKKVFAVVLMISLLLMSVSSFAATKEDFIYAMTEYQPLKSAIKGSMYIDAKKLPEELFDDPNASSFLSTKISFEGKMDAKEDFSSMKMYLKMSYDFPTDVEAIMADMNQECWYDFDADKMMFITKVGEDSYQYVDYNNIDGYKDLMTTVLSKEYLEDYKQSMKEMTKENAEIDITDNSAVVTIPSSKLNAFFESFADLIKPVISKALETAVSQADIADTADIEKSITDVVTVLKNVKIFSDDAIVINVTLGDDNTLKDYNVSINIDANVYDIANSISKVIEDAKIPENITKENSDVLGSVKIETSYENLENVDISYPELTGDNSFDLEYVINIPQDGKINVIINNKKIEYDVIPQYIGDELYLPLRKTLNGMGVVDNAIAYNDGIVIAQIGDTVIVTAIDSNILSIADKTLNLDSKIIEMNDRTLVPVEFFTQLSNNLEGLDKEPVVLSASQESGANVIFTKQK